MINWSLFARGSYRVQLRKEFPLAELRLLRKYFDDLGVSTVYSSPILQSVPGSNHGYDCSDFQRIDSERGTLEELKEVILYFKEKGIGWLQDIVPNHMAFNPCNPYLRDVLEHGQLSPYAKLFDINWNHRRPDSNGKVLAPILGKPLYNLICEGEVKLEYIDGELEVVYWAHRYPLNLASWPLVFANGNLEGIDALITKTELDSHDCVPSPDTPTLNDLIDRCRKWPPHGNLSGAARIDVQANHLKKDIWSAYSNNPLMKSLVDESINFFNSKSKKAVTAFHSVLAMQHYRLTFWRYGNDILNYRRFFSINELIAVRMHDPEVFELTHKLIISLVNEGLIDGVRIDHIDGLKDPILYLQNLRSAINPNLPTSILVEKILVPDEALRFSFPTDGTFQGTTGYEWMNAINKLMIENIDKFEQIYRTFTREKRDLVEIWTQCQYELTHGDFRPETDNLTDILLYISNRNLQWSELTESGLSRTVCDFATALRSYRTYYGLRTDVEQETPTSAESRARIQHAFDRAERRTPQRHVEFDFMKMVILEPSNLIDNSEEIGDSKEIDDSKKAAHEFVLALQQYCGPLFAKGIEDWLIYLFSPLISLCEVGSEPVPLVPYTLDLYHGDMKERSKIWPYSLNTLCTHDTKRDPDVRARINALSENPEQWQKKLHEWAKINEDFVHDYDSRTGRTRVPSLSGEYFIYQTLLGSCPTRENEWDSWIERLQGNEEKGLLGYFPKAIREEREHTNWLTPDLEYEKYFNQFVGKILKNKPFLDSFIPFQKHLAHFGILNTLSQVALQTTSPGIPDIYQGTELLSLSLVDPDNRRAVDYEARSELLSNIKMHVAQGTLGKMIDRMKLDATSGELKLLAYERLLNARKEHQCLVDGGYVPVPVDGLYQDHIIAYLRTASEQAVLVVIPRLMTHIVHEGQFPCGPDIWAGTTLVLPEEYQNIRWKNLLTGEQNIDADSHLLVGAALRNLPIAALAIQAE
jgi:(1->4)-alpha-D-glucan 1-alpha-D-glucosylmutase